MEATGPAVLLGVSVHRLAEAVDRGLRVVVVLQLDGGINPVVPGFEGGDVD